MPYFALFLLLLLALACNPQPEESQRVPDHLYGEEAPEDTTLPPATEPKEARKDGLNKPQPPEKPPRNVPQKAQTALDYYQRINLAELEERMLEKTKGRKTYAYHRQGQTLKYLEVTTKAETKVFRQYYLREGQLVVALENHVPLSRPAENRSMMVVYQKGKARAFRNAEGDWSTELGDQAAGKAQLLRQSLMELRERTKEQK